MFAINLHSAILVAAILTVGCSVKQAHNTAPVKGKVTYKGKAIPTGTVMFVPDEGPAATGEISADGSYRLSTYSTGDGAVIGHHQVAVIALQVTTGLPEKRNPIPPPLVPPKYMDHSRSGLTADVKLGDNEVNLDLRD